MVMRKSPNRIKMPYSSIRKPVNGQRRRMRKIPDANAAVPFIFWGREKKAMVFGRPIISVRPIRKRIYVGFIPCSCRVLIKLVLGPKEKEGGADLRFPLQAYMMIIIFMLARGIVMRYERFNTYNERSKNMRTPPNKNNPPSISINQSVKVQFQLRPRRGRDIPPEQKMTPISNHRKVSQSSHQSALQVLTLILREPHCRHCLSIPFL